MSWFGRKPTEEIIADQAARLRQAQAMNAELARQLGLMEAQRNHARWKNGRRRTKMREMRKRIKQLEAAVMRELDIETQKLELVGAGK